MLINKMTPLRKRVYQSKVKKYADKNNKFAVLWAIIYKLGDDRWSCEYEPGKKFRARENLR